MLPEYFSALLIDDLIMAPYAPSHSWTVQLGLNKLVCFEFKSFDQNCFIDDITATYFAAQLPQM